MGNSGKTNKVMIMFWKPKVLFCYTFYRKKREQYLFLILNNVMKRLVMTVLKALGNVSETCFQWTLLLYGRHSNHLMSLSTSSWHFGRPGCWGGSRRHNWTRWLTLDNGETMIVAKQGDAFEGLVQNYCNFLYEMR